MLYNLYRTVAGKKDLMITDTLKNVKAREKQLKSGSRKSGRSGKRVTFSIEEASETDEKFFKPPHTQWTNY